MCCQRLSEEFRLWEVISFGHEISLEKVSSSPTSTLEFVEDMKSSRLTSEEIIDDLIPQEGPLPPTMIMDMELTLWELTLWELFKNGRKGAI
jgi:hypothetical protein